jgi:TolB-like protein
MQTSEEVSTVSSANYFIRRIKQHKYAAVILLTVIATAAFFAYRSLLSSRSQPIESIAVMPFTNESGNADIDYLSDGMTDMLITNLSQLPNLSVKARNSVFRYKGKDASPHQVGQELNVQAMLNGRVVQRGNDLTLHIELVDVKTETALWSADYNRSMTNLISLQSEIARDVSQKLRVRLSSGDEQKVAKNYTSNVEAYQLYLKGRYHIFKITPPEVERGISYFHQAIELDPNYALAYVGLSVAYRSFSLSFDRPATEGMSKAKDAAQKAVDIDDNLAEAHAALGFAIFWYDWDFNAAEAQLKRALELNPNSGDAHWAYGAILSTLGRHTEALAEIKRARELDPLSLLINTTEGEILLYSGQTDSALAVFQKTFELDPKFWIAHMFAALAYIEKRMFPEALAEARQARELNLLSSMPISLVGCTLAQSGKRTEARAVLEELLKLSKQRYVPPYHIAMVYAALGDRDEALSWLERSFKERDPKMVFLKVEPKWNILRDDRHFQDLLRRVGF